MTESDSLYHRLFSHPLMVEHLVREFVPEAMAAGLDFTGLERVNAKFHARAGRRRDGDVIWRLPTAAGVDVYLYLLLEFQSESDWWMAVRIQVYAGLLWQHVIQESRLVAGDRLPPILPIVVYNGDARWKAPQDMGGLLAVPPESPLWPWQPGVRYYLLDEGAFPGNELARRKSLVALLFRLEHCRRPDELVGLVDEVIGWFRSHPDYAALKHLFTEVTRQAVLGMNRQGAIIPVPDDLLEVRSMLATRAQEWMRQMKAEGLAEGLAEGVAEGKVRGKAEMLLRQFTRRFGGVPTDVEARIRCAPADMLDHWMDRLMDAASPEDVFADQPH